MRLDLTNMGLTTVTRDLTGCTILDCRHNHITSLPELPDTLEELICSYNELTSLPPLPPKLTKLWCGSNKLTTLPKLPETITFISCGNNEITSLPEIPDSLKTIWCRHNKMGLENSHDDNLKLTRLNQHNEKRRCLGLDIVEQLPSKEEVIQIRQLWLYRPGGQKYLECEKIIESSFS